VLCKSSFSSEDEAHKAIAADWNKAFKAMGIKIHKPNYGIIIHGVPTDIISSAVLATPSTGITQSLEKQNIPQGTITKITALRRR
jgi:hypothetical protein